MDKKKGPKDAVCGLDLKTGEGIHHEHEGADYHFCSQTCLNEFKADPIKYVSKEEEISYGAAGEPIIYTCQAGHGAEADEEGDWPDCKETSKEKDK